MNLDRINEWIHEREELASKATEGPWEAYVIPESKGEPGYAGVEIGEHEARLNWLNGSWLDAAFIADARTSLPLATKALKALLERHSPIKAMQCNGPNQRIVTVCTACSLRHGDEGPWVAHPCPDLTTIAAALAINLRDVTRQENV